MYPRNGSIDGRRLNEVDESKWDHGIEHNAHEGSRDRVGVVMRVSGRRCTCRVMNGR